MSELVDDYNEIKEIMEKYTIWLNDCGYIDEDLYSRSQKIVERFFSENSDGINFTERRLNPNE